MPDPLAPIRVLAVDDHPVVRHGLRSLLAGHADLLLVGEADNGGDVLPFLAANAIDVVLLDIRLQGRSGLDVARQVLRARPDVKIVILTTYDDESYLREALEIGVHGFLLKSVSHESLPDSIRAVMRGERLVSPSLVSNVVSDYQGLLREQARRESGVSEEDLQILAAIAGGATNKDLAERFYWSEATVKRKVQDILTKLGVSSRAQASAEAVRRGWI